MRGHADWIPTEADLTKLREVQRLAYRCAETVAAQLRPGVTEKQAAARLRRYLIERGVDDWFHLPFAWFGDRTAFRGLYSFPFLALRFFPTERKLDEGMPYILDCAPVVRGYSTDIGYAGCLGENATWDALMDDLAEHRALVLELVRKGLTLREIYKEDDRLIAEQGNENRHRAYPFGVIAHQVWRFPSRPSRVTLARFGVRSLARLARTTLAGRRQGWSPLWSDRRSSDHPITPGLWAVEPHIGRDGVGAKFEEILVVTENDAFWLDDDLPHVRRWTQRQIAS